MRRGAAIGWMLAACASACGSSPAPAPIAPVIAHAAEPVLTVAPTAEISRPCHAAAMGLERGTRELRAPESTIADAMAARCRDDNWPADAIACFAGMGDDELAKCAAALSVPARTALFEQLVAGAGDPRAALEVATIQLVGMTVGVAACDHFIAAVAGAMHCESMPIDTRVELGNQTLQLWDLPTHGLPADAVARMTAICDASSAQLQQQATTAGCTP